MYGRSPRLGSAALVRTARVYGRLGGVYGRLGFGCTDGSARGVRTARLGCTDGSVHSAVRTARRGRLGSTPIFSYGAGSRGFGPVLPILGRFKHFLAGLKFFEGFEAGFGALKALLGFFKALLL